MKINKYILSLLTVTLVCSSLLVGCNQDTNETTLTVEEIPIETVESIPEETVIETIPEETTTVPSPETENIYNITITVINTSDINIGMFSAINPLTKEQMDLNRLDSGTSISFECNWPSNETTFYWALYNEQGDLCLEASTDMSAATKSAILLLRGEGTIDDVDVTIE